MASPYKDIPYEITQDYGCTGYLAELPFRGCDHYHQGVDLGHRAGPPHPKIYATTRQQIFAFARDNDGANYVITSDGRGCFHAYWHLNEILCPHTGTWVDPGVQPLGTEGSTGKANGDHLHYEVQQKTLYGTSLHTPDNPIDPTPYLQDAQGGADDMNPRQLVESLYDLLVGSRPSEEVLAAKAQYVADNGPQQVVKDLIDAGSRYMSQRRALSTYQQARVDAGSRYPDGSIYNPDTFAEDRLNGGGNFQSVIEGDVAYYIAQDQHLQDLLSKDVPAPLSPDDQEDLAFGKTVRSYMKGLK